LEEKNSDILFLKERKDDRNIFHIQQQNEWQVMKEPLKDEIATSFKPISNSLWNK